ncbi:MAG: hypothetical protein L6265_06420 [Thermoplasmatales archaeon]|nr:hypothetical protein [Thermoplasmatales archaeon]
MKKITIFVVIWMLVCMIPMSVTAAQTTITAQETDTVNSVGDIHMEWVIAYPTTLYSSIAAQYEPNEYLLIRELIGYKTQAEIKNPDVDFDSMNRKITVSLTLLGGATNKGDHWELKMAPDVFGFNVQGTTARFSQASTIVTASGQVTVTAALTVKLPENAKDITYDSGSHTLKYVLPKDFVSENRYLTIGLLATGMIACVILLAYTMIKSKGISMRPGRARAAPKAYTPFTPAGGTKFCMLCAAKIPRGAGVCPECGTRQE